VKVTELCEPTGDVMYKNTCIYIYINVLNPNTRGLNVQTFVDVHIKYKAELVVSSSVVVEGNDALLIAKIRNPLGVNVALGFKSDIQK